VADLEDSVVAVVAVEQARLQAGDLAASSSPLERTRMTKSGSSAQRILATGAPALILTALGFSELDRVLRHLSALTTEPGLLTDALLARGVLYAVFVFAAAITLVTNSGPFARDGRRSVIAISLIASFLMVAANLAPTGPTLWMASPRVAEVGVAITVVGAALALAAFMSLGRSFSVIPEARELVTRGVYRFVRHPMYLAELLMIVGVLFGEAQLTTLIGTLIVIGLQVHRVRLEERLLRSTLPSSFAPFAQRTSYRLVPFLW
jgi:protein-S-isoprenylcysteine O-methyltransferase Ste14